MLPRRHIAAFERDFDPSLVQPLGCHAFDSFQFGEITALECAIHKTVDEIGPFMLTIVFGLDGQVEDRI